MRMPAFLALLVLSLAAPVLHAAPALTDFAHQAQIETSAAGPFQRLTLPLAVYQGRARADLGDLRVFNGRGEILPYALWRGDAGEQATKPVERLWSALLTPSAVSEGSYDYVVPGQLPLERLRIELPQANLLLPYTLQRELCGTEFHRHHLRPREECYWQQLAQGVAYRLESPDGESRAADLELPGMPVARLRLLFDQRGGSLVGASPAIRIGFVPQDLVFLARGEPPFTLAWGAATVAAADLPLATLIPAYRAGAALPAGSARLLPELSPPRSAAVSAASADKTGATRPWLLWSVLLAGLLIMALLARSLIVQMGKAKDKAKDQAKEMAG